MTDRETLLPTSTGMEAAGSTAPSQTADKMDTEGPHVEAKLNEDDQQALEDAESEISQILATGIQDTSIMDNEADCIAVWQHIKEQDYENDIQDEIGIDKRLKSVVRAYAEGSALNLTTLITKLRTHIAAYCDITGGYQDARFEELVPLMITRKNLGEAFNSTNGTERMENTRHECMWVWESPEVDVFPTTIREQVMAARDTRNLVSRRYKTLLTVKNAILSGDKTTRMEANEQLGIIYKKMLLEREKQERLDKKRKAAEVKPQQLMSPFTKMAHVRDSKGQHSKTGASGIHDKAGNRVAGKPAAVKPKPPNMLLNWLKTSNNTNSSSGGNTSRGSGAGGRNSDPSHPNRAGDVGGYYGEPTIEDFEDMGATEAQMTQIAKLLEEIPRPKYAKRDDADTPDVLDIIKQKAQGSEDRDKKVDGFSDFLKTCEKHRDAWKRYFTFVHTNRKFYVDASMQSVANLNPQEPGNAEGPNVPEHTPKTFVVDDVVNNLRDAIYGDASLRPTRGARVFQMSDNTWKRPCMRLVIARDSQTVKPTDPLAIEPVMDYFVDSDEDWFEQFDADDVDESGSEEEEEEDEENDWIVQDNPQQGPQKHTLNLCEVVKVFCMNKNWHWIVDGVPQNNNECCSVEEAKKNGISIVQSDYGFGYEGYTQNPISDFITNMRGHNIIMTKEDVQEFLKLCHAKHTKKETLISDFKEMKPHCSMSEIKEKFKKYICRMKVDSTPQRWLVTTEAALLFGIRDELDAILAAAMEQVVENE
ncbi:hypothetical protein BaOVIS_022420 [Babesia ovis]|uniref:Chromatin assembly factor 1 subunit A dimerization domain-containing protein n=1 Tax=Babesia ovis TaxID=5869 RepID=A0A9W5WVD5_BABOV|nr:hypothetical protein BaOVIS_022420 [Babesia ovis]